MNDLLSQFVASAKSIALSEAEKAHVRQTLEVFVTSEGSVLSSAQQLSMSYKEKESGLRVLREFIYSHPITSGERVSWINLLHRLFSLRFASGVMAAFVIFFAIGGAAAYAAESTLPGDTLYPLKVYITEPLREHLSLTPRARAAWRAERIVRRLHEVEELLVRSPDQEDIASFEERVTHHMEKMKERLADIESQDDAEVLRLRLENAIRHHESVLSRLEMSAVPEKEVSEFHDHIRQRKQYLRQMLREYVQVPKENRGVEGHEDMGGEMDEEVHEGEDHDLNPMPTELHEESSKEEYLPRTPLMLPKVLQKMHHERKQIRGTKDDSESNAAQDPPYREEEKPLPSQEEREAEENAPIPQILEREILPFTLFKHLPRKE